ncbi:MAG: ABC transporter permease [Candidatus Moranbacteria bacterium]|nr:ABC transporter permease [Candidatus Moranbacteria bacterium]
MRISDPLKISFRNIMAAKVRSFLTILGIIIGIGSVIIIMAIGTSAQQLILNQIRGIGSNLIGVLPGASEEKGPPAGAFGIAITTLKYNDLQAILKKQNAPNVVDGAAYVNGSKTAQFQDQSRSVSFTGTTASYVGVENVSVANGRFFTKEEEADLSRVAVLGSQVAEDFFGKNLDPIGKRIRVGDQSFTIVGVLASRGSTAFSNQDKSIFMPLFTAQKIILGIDYVNFLRLKVDDEKNIDRAVADIKATLRDQHQIKNPADDDFTVRDQRAGLDAITSVTNAIKYFLTAIAAISLLVGGVGIMNTMLISVNERIREVGLRKAIGAKNNTVMFQFLMESAVITLAGGVVGIVFGTLVSLLAAIIMQKLGYQWPFVITASSVVLAVVISTAVGIFFGLYPARRAAKYNIVEALRYE